MHEYDHDPDKTIELELVQSESLTNCDNYELLPKTDHELKLEQLIKEQAIRSRRNSANLVIIKYVAVIILGLLSIASAFDISGNKPSWHGDRLQAILITVLGGFGASALGLSDRIADNLVKSKDKNSNQNH